MTYMNTRLNTIKPWKEPLLLIGRQGHIYPERLSPAALAFASILAKMRLGKVILTALFDRRTNQEHPPHTVLSTDYPPFNTDKIKKLQSSCFLFIININNTPHASH